MVAKNKNKHKPHFKGNPPLKPTFCGSSTIQTHILWVEVLPTIQIHILRVDHHSNAHFKGGPKLTRIFYGWTTIQAHILG